LPLVITPAGLPSTNTGLVGARRTTTLDAEAAQHAGHAALALGGQGLATAEALGLVPRDHPAQAGLERGDAGPELVAVQRQARLEPQRVAGARARRARSRRQQASQRSGP
jgi:hypothetical protein